MGINLKNDSFFDNLFYSKWKNSYKTISPWEYGNKNLNYSFSIPIATKKDIENIFLIAKKKFESWSNTKTSIVIEKINKFSEELLLNQTEIINCCHLETGKTKEAAKSEFLRTIDYIKTSLSVFESLQDTCYNLDAKLGVFTRQPLGIVLAISPFNYPINLLVSKIIPALLMKNCLVIKPASNGSLTAMWIFKCLINAGFELGVANLVLGKGEEISDLLVTNKDINLINFTGSTFVGKIISKKVHFSQLIMELGGNDPAMILEDADLKNAVKEILSGAFSYNGQRCTAIKRVYVIDKVFDKFKDIFLSEFQKNITFTCLPEKNASITPLINKSAFDNASKIFKESIKSMNHQDFNVFYLKETLTKTFIENNKASKTASFIVEEWKKTAINDKDFDFLLKDKNLIAPTIVFINKADYFSLIEKEEQFAPILPIIKCKSLEEMIFLANNTKYGLQASLFTKSIDNINECFLKIKCGTLNINQQTKRSPDIFPFQGIKSSGISQQGIFQSFINNSTIKGLVIKK